MDSSLTVYLDFKSPYAYLAVEPTRRLGRELGLAINWLPFVLDIPSYLGSASLNKSGEVAQASRSADQWSGVKYAYYDCRRYANLRGLTIRGTVKIWDTNLAAIGMLWAREFGDDILQRYIDGIYVPFWKRELDVEDIAVVEEVLVNAGAAVKGFRAFAAGEGAQKNQQIQREAFDRGIFGVPTYVVGDDLYFGREHLPRIRWRLEGERGPAPDIGYESLPDDVVAGASGRELQVGISLEEPEGLLAIPRVLTLAQELDLNVDWYALPPKKPARHADSNDVSRGARHRRFRTENRQRDQDRYVAQALAGGDSATAIAALLAKTGVNLRAGGTESALVGAGYVGSPVFGIGDETFIGRQHLPLIRARFQNLL